MPIEKKTNWSQVQRESEEARKRINKVLKYQKLIQAIVTAQPDEYIDLTSKIAKPMSEATQEELEKSLKRVTEIYDCFTSAPDGIEKIRRYSNALQNEIIKR